MPSIRAHLTNLFLRAAIKSQWKTDMNLAEMRARQDRIGRRWGGEAPGMRTDEISIAGRPGMKITPVSGPASRTLLYFHGGAFIFHMPELYRRMAGGIGRRLNATVYVQDYRLAPEHPFPAGFEDCLAAYREVIASGIDPARLVVGGDSAGGQLTFAVLIAAKVEGLPMPACAFAMSPATSCIPLPSETTNASRDPLFAPLAFTWFKKLWLQGFDDIADPRISPVEGDLRGFPPVRIDAGSTEMIVDHAQLMAERIRAAGREAELEIWDRLPHVFQGVSYLPESRMSFERITAFVSRHIP